MRAPARHAAGLPVIRRGFLVRRFDAGPDRTARDIERVPEPCGNQRDMFKVRRRVDQRVDGGAEIRHALGIVNVFALGDAFVEHAIDACRAVNELARAGDQRDGRQFVLKRIRVGGFEALFDFEG